MTNHTIGHDSWDSHERVCNLFRQSNRGDIAFVLLLLTTVVRVKSLQPGPRETPERAIAGTALGIKWSVCRSEPPQADCRSYLHEVR